MSTGLASAMVLLLTIVSAFFGGYARTIVPTKYIHPDAKTVIQLAAGLIGTLAALVLGLLIASAKSNFDAAADEVVEITRNDILIDQMLSRYGDETLNTRLVFRKTIESLADRIWREGHQQSGSFEPTYSAVEFINALSSLPTSTEPQRTMKAAIIQSGIDLTKKRLSLYVYNKDTITTPFLSILVFWLMVIFAIFGLLARPGPVIGAVFLVCAISFSGAVFLILDLSRPFDGVMQISDVQLRNALPALSQAALDR